MNPSGAYDSPLSAPPLSPAISVVSRPASQKRIHRVTDPHIVRAIRRASTPMKRLLDIAGATVGLVFLTPIMLPLAAAIWLTSDGPVLIGPERAGRFAKPFRSWRFRTTNIETGEYTLLGSYLSAAGIDGLPQLINVLRGEMSLVGPKALPKDELDAGYGKQRCYYLLLRPGLTGLWSGESIDENFGRRIALDRKYIREWSYLGDLGILFEAALTSLMGGRREA